MAYPTTVTERALIQRINRKLAHKWEKLRTSSKRAFNNLGRFHVIDSYRNSVILTHVKLEDLARDIGVMHPLERMEAA